MRADAELIEWLAENNIIEGFASVDEDIHEIAAHLSEERGHHEPSLDDRCDALRILIDRAITAEAQS